MDGIKGFIVYPTYRIIDNKAYVYLFGRLENGESFLTINQFRPYFCIRAKDREKAEGILKEIKEIDVSKYVKNEGRDKDGKKNNLYYPSYKS